MLCEVQALDFLFFFSIALFMRVRDAKHCNAKKNYKNFKNLRGPGFDSFIHRPWIDISACFEHCNVS